MKKTKKIPAHSRSLQENIVDTIAAEQSGDFVIAGEIGSTVLAQRADFACQAASLNQNVIAFSLFGNNPVYCETALLNAQQLSTVYPGWAMWIYHDHSVPTAVLSRLAAAGVRLIDVTTIGIAHWPGTFWRFYAACEPHAAYVLFRDADSIISAREAQWVDQWLATGKPFHVMRDWYSHVDLILAGLWGAYVPLLAHMANWVDDYIANEPLHPTHADQEFLAKVIWPRIHQFAVIHDSIHHVSGQTAIDSPKLGSHSSDALGGFKCRRLEITLPQGIRRYSVEITDEHGHQICHYERLANEQWKDQFDMPTAYLERVDRGEWKINYQVFPDAQKAT